MRRKDESVIEWLDRTCDDGDWSFCLAGEEEINEIVTLKLEDLGVLETVSEYNDMTNEEYIYQGVELAWRWFRTSDVKNSVDSGIRCMDIDDTWIISTDDLVRGTGPGVAALVRQLEFQTANKPPRSMSRLKELMNSGEIVSQAEDEAKRNK